MTSVLTLKHEDVKFIKLKLGNSGGQFLKSVPSDRILLDRFVETWNECSQTERYTFLMSVGSQMKLRLKEHIDLMRKRKSNTTQSVESLSSLSNSQFTEEVTSPNHAHQGLIKELFELISTASSASSLVKEVIQGLMNISQNQTTTPRDFTNIFQGSLVESYMGRGLLTGDKVILTDQHYGRFTDDIINLVVRNNSDGQQHESNQIPGGLSTVIVIYLVILEDKIIDNMFYLRKFMTPQTPDYFSVVQELFHRTQPREPTIESSIAPNKSRVGIVIGPIRENHRYFKQRKVLSQINTTAFINRYQDLSIVGAFYSVDVCRQKLLIDAESIIYANFMDLNQLTDDCSLENTSIQVREQLVSSPSRQDNQSQCSQYNREKCSYKSGFGKHLGTLNSTSSKQSNCPVYNDEGYLNSPCSSTRDCQGYKGKAGFHPQSNYKQKKSGHFQDFVQDQYQFRELHSSKNPKKNNQKNKKGRNYEYYGGKLGLEEVHSNHDYQYGNQVPQQRKKLNSEVIDTFNEYMEPDWQNKEHVRPKKKSQNWNQNPSKKYNSDFNQQFPSQVIDPSGYLVKTPSFNLDDVHSKAEIPGNRSSNIFPKYSKDHDHYEAKPWMSDTISLNRYQSQHPYQGDEGYSKKSLDSSTHSKDASFKGSQNSLPTSAKKGTANSGKKPAKTNKWVASPELDLSQPGNQKSSKKADYLIYSGPNKAEDGLKEAQGSFLQLPSQIPGNRRDTGALGDFDTEKRRASGFDEEGNRKDTGFEVGIENLKELGSNRPSGMNLSQVKEPQEAEGSRRRNTNLSIMFQDGPFSRLKSNKQTPLPVKEKEYENRQAVILEFSKPTKNK